VLYSIDLTNRLKQPRAFVTNCILHIASGLLCAMHYFYAAPIVILNRAGHYIFALWFLLSSVSIFFSSPNLSRCRSDVDQQDAGLKCAASGLLKIQDAKSPKNCHLGTIAQICWAISSQLGHVSTAISPPHILKVWQTWPTSG